MQLWRLPNPKICRVRWQARDPVELMLSQFKSEEMSQLKCNLARGILLFEGGPAFLFCAGLQLMG